MKCPKCSSVILLSAIKCKHCGGFFVDESHEVKQAKNSKLQSRMKPIVTSIIIGAILCGGGYFVYSHNAKSQYNRGLSYIKGDGVPKDINKGVNLLTKAANWGNADAQFNLGLMYDMGGLMSGMRDVTQDKKKAFDLFTKAAKQELAEAQYFLGGMYFKGDGVAQDKKKAFELLTKAANQGLEDAQYALGAIYDTGDSVVTQDKNKAVEWYTKAANHGNANAQLALGIMYFKGDGVAQDMNKAVEWSTKAADQGLKDAQDFLSSYRHILYTEIVHVSGH